MLGTNPASRICFVECSRMLGTYHLNGLFDILKELHFIYDPVKLWRYVLEQSCKYLQAEAATFFLAIKDETELEVAAAHGVDENRLKQVPFHRGVGICGWALQYHQPALVADVSTDNRFNRAVDAVTGLKTNSVLCVPVLSQKRCYGVIELLNRKSGQFNPQDQEFLTVLGRQAAAAYQNLLMYAEMNEAKTLLQSVLENLSGGLIAMSGQGAILIFNPAAGRLLGVIDGEAIGKPAKEVLRDYPWFVEIMEKTLQTRATVSREEVQLSVRGADARVGYTTIMISDRQKNSLGAGVIFQQLSKP
jgi:PAS domain S-box-containing protein